MNDTVTFGAAFDQLHDLAIKGNCNVNVDDHEVIENFLREVKAAHIRAFTPAMVERCRRNDNGPGLLLCSAVEGVLTDSQTAKERRSVSELPPSEFVIEDLHASETTAILIHKIKPHCQGREDITITFSNVMTETTDMRNTNGQIDPQKFSQLLDDPANVKDIIVQDDYIAKMDGKVTLKP